MQVMLISNKKFHLTVTQPIAPAAFSLWIFMQLALLLALGAGDALAARKSVQPAAPAAVTAPAPAGPLPIGYLERRQPLLATYSNLDPEPRDAGLRGAQLGLVDNETTGRFTGQHFELRARAVEPGEDIEGAFLALAAEGIRHVILNVTAADLLQLADRPEARGMLLYNIAAPDDALRGEQCRANLLHIVPSRAMRADALAQFLLKKRWQKILIVSGAGEGDRQLVAAFERAAKKLKLKIVDVKHWDVTHDPRRTAQSEVPVLTQGKEHDVVYVADEAAVFGEYLPYRTWLPRPVVGTQGLVATAWHRTHEQWGAVQLQTRFLESAGRWMTERDYAAWLAVRAIGEAATRTRSLEFAVLREYLLGERLALAGFKGVPLSFRSWNGQLRQPLLLAADRSMVAVAPLEGFLHPKTELDTLGYDQPESTCTHPPR